MKNYSFARTIYLYLFSLLGLVLLIIGGIRFIDMGLKAFVFTKADEEERVMYSRHGYMPYPLEKIITLQEEEVLAETLSEEEKIAIKEWLIDYKEWKEIEKNINPVASRRHRDASSSLSMILIGLPLYFYHWRIIIKEARKKKEDNCSA